MNSGSVSGVPASHFAEGIQSTQQLSDSWSWIPFFRFQFLYLITIFDFLMLYSNYLLIYLSEKQNLFNVYMKFSFLVFDMSLFCFNDSAHSSWHGFSRFVRNLMIHFRLNQSENELEVGVRK